MALVPTQQSKIQTEDSKPKRRTTIIYYGRIESKDRSRAENSESEANIVPEMKVESELGDPKKGPQKLKLNSVCVDVIVRNAVSPVYFTIQNYRQSEYLKELEIKMTLFYDSFISSSTLAFTDLILHGFYATKLPNDDGNATGNWVRCKILKPFKENMPVLTYLIDHGLYHTTQPSCIQLLRKEYIIFPAQAYEAKLHFIENPNHFTPEDCRRFYDEVEGKSFVGIITNAGKDDDKIGIILIDTSSNDGKDNYIHHNYTKNKSY